MIIDDFQEFKFLLNYYFNSGYILIQIKPNVYDLSIYTNIVQKFTISFYGDDQIHIINKANSKAIMVDNHVDLSHFLYDIMMKNSTKRVHEYLLCSKTHIEFEKSDNNIHFYDMFNSEYILTQNELKCTLGSGEKLVFTTNIGRLYKLLKKKKENKISFYKQIINIFKKSKN